MSLQVVTIGDDGTVQQGVIKLPADTEIGGSAVVALGTITSDSANAFTVGRQGTTDPVLNVNAATASVVTGINLTGAAAAGGMAIAVTSSGTNESLTINAKGTGTVAINSVGGTGAVRLGGAASGNNATGLTVTPAAAAGGLAVAVVSTGTDENLTINAKGAGTVTINGTATGNVVIGKLRGTPVVTAASGDGAIAIATGTVTITKGSIAALTVAAPSSNDGVRITIVSTTDFAHVVTFTGGTLYDGTAGANTTVTFPTTRGASVTVVAVGVLWMVESFNAVTIAPA